MSCFCQNRNLDFWRSEAEGGEIGVMPLVHVKEDESFENALRRFKRKCEKSGILSELKKLQHYEKPSTKRKRKAIGARKKNLRKLADERRTGYSSASGTRDCIHEGPRGNASPFFHAD